MQKKGPIPRNGLKSPKEARPPEPCKSVARKTPKKSPPACVLKKNKAKNLLQLCKKRAGSRLDPQANSPPPSPTRPQLGRAV